MNEKMGGQFQEIRGDSSGRVRKRYKMQENTTREGKSQQRSGKHTFLEGNEEIGLR